MKNRDNFDYSTLIIGCQYTVKTAETYSNFEDRFLNQDLQLDFITIVGIFR